MEFSLNSKKINLINKNGEKINEFFFKNINQFKHELFLNNQNYYENFNFDNYSDNNSSCETLSINSNNICKGNNILYTNFFNNYNNDKKNFKIKTKLFY